MEASITLKSIAKKFDGKTILADLSFGVETGTNFVVVGKNGAGKSTLLKLLTGLVESDAGSAYIHGLNIHTRGVETRSVTGFMPQSCNLDEEMTIYDNIAVYAQLQGMTKTKINQEVVKLSDRLNIKHQLKKFPHQLCYGDQRKVCFIRAIIHKPKVIILDEPTTGLDPKSRGMIWEMLEEHKETRTVVFTTQNLIEAERYADRIAILFNGNIRMDGTLDKLIETTQGLSRYKITFRENPEKSLIDEIFANPKVVRPSCNGKDLEFYSREKRSFFNILKIALKQELDDFDSSGCRLNDLFLGLTEGGLE